MYVMETRTIMKLMVWFISYSSITYAHSSQNLTGHYEMPASSNRCSAETLDNSPGNAYIWHCFTGDAYGYSPTLEIVQNGLQICGTYTECGSYNCNKIYSGPLAGRIENNQLLFYWTNGHRNEVSAELIRYEILKNGLKEIQTKSKTPSLIVRSKLLKNPSVVAQCNPVFPKEVMITADSDLNVKGILSEAQTKFVGLTQKQYIAPPAKHRIKFSKKPADFEWRDQRTSANFVVRQLTLVNDTNRSWTVEVVHPDACTEFLSSSYNKNKDLISKKGNSIEIERNQKIDLNSCNGSVWTFENKIACPTMQCSESCKC
jgi:hypothetical protein